MSKDQSNLINISVNVLIPTLILLKGIPFFQVNPFNRLLIALSFPFFYGVFELMKSKKTNMFSVLGVVSILLTGGIGLLKLSSGWLAIKEALIPSLIGFTLIMSAYLKKPLVKLLFNKFLNISIINEALIKKNKEFFFEKCCIEITYYIGGTFFISAILNYFITRMVVTASPGTLLFMEQLGRLTFISYFVIAIPCMFILILICYFTIKKLKSITGLKFEDMLILNR